MADRTYLDWPFLEDRHRSLKATLDEWCAGRSFPHDGDIDDICRGLVVDLGAAGILANCVPAQWGGTSESLDVRSLALCRETLAWHSGLADFSFAMQGLGSGAISLFGTESQRASYLPRVAKGEAIAAFALSEAEAGSDVAAMATSAESDGDGYVLNGSKTWISNGGIADFYCVFARTGEAPGARGLSAFIVDADNPGLSIAERIETTAPHPLATLSFEDCRVGSDTLIGSGGEGFKVEFERKLNVSKEVAKLLAKMASSMDDVSVLDKNVVKNLDEVAKFWQLGVDFHDMQVAARHATDIVKSVKILGGGNFERSHDVSVTESIEQALSLLKSNLRSVQLDVIWGELPVIHGNLTELIQIWVNIIKNACDAMEAAGTEGPRVKIKMRVLQGSVKVSMSDNGPGIPEELQDKIFQPNFTTKKNGLQFGLGLGLSIVMRLVESYGGRIVLNSVPGKTTFSVTLPIGERDGEN